MTDPRSAPSPGRGMILTLPGLLVLGVRHRWLVLLLVLFGALGGGIRSLMSARLYTSSALFVPEDGGEGRPLAETARRFGLAIPGGGQSGWSPSLYVEVLKSRSVLERLAGDTVLVEEEGRRAAVVDLLGIDDRDPRRRTERAVRYLTREVVRASEARAVGAVTLRVTTRWPSVSYAIAVALLEDINDFNVRIRQSQAAAELAYAEARTFEAEGALREAEERLLRFLERNRQFASSPALLFERDRLTQDAETKRQLYQSLLASRNDARLRKVRDTPVISIIEAPRSPAIGDPRGTVLRTILGAFAGGLLALGVLLLRQLSATGWSGTPDQRMLLQELHRAAPRFLRRRFPADPESLDR